MTQTKQKVRGRTVLGFPIAGFSLFQGLLLAVALGFLAFFAATTIAIFALIAWNGLGGHTVSYADSYRYIGLPAGVIALVVALPVFLAVWVKGKKLQNHSPNDRSQGC